MIVAEKFAKYTKEIKPQIEEMLTFLNRVNIQKTTTMEHHNKSFFFFFFFYCLFNWSGSKLQHAGSSSLTRDQTWSSLCWECRVLATGPPGKSHNKVLKPKTKRNLKIIRAENTEGARLMASFSVEAVEVHRQRSAFLRVLIGNDCRSRILNLLKIHWSVINTFSDRFIVS